MKINGKNYRTIWEKEQTPGVIQIIDQTKLPHSLEIIDLKNSNDIIIAIKEMYVRGAPLIGVTAAYGIYISALESLNSINFKKELIKKINLIRKARPTAVNLMWAVDKQLKLINTLTNKYEIIDSLLNEARKIAEEDVETCFNIGKNGYEIIKEIAKNKTKINILTHCNAGWLATVDWGTALAPIYYANRQGMQIHVWVDETRPRNQGARLTSFELNHESIDNTIIVDNAGGYLMQKGLVDLVLVGSDRTTFTGDVANKIGTYLKALAAKENHIPFYVALPSSTIDWKLSNGINDIPIEERDPNEVKYIEGFADGKIQQVLITPENSKAKNFAFDVTPAYLVTGLITERGICKANEKDILKLFPEKNG